MIIVSEQHSVAYVLMMLRDAFTCNFSEAGSLWTKYGKWMAGDKRLTLKIFGGIAVMAPSVGIRKTKNQCWMFL